MGKYFGTDGFRGRANCTLNANHAFEIGRYLGSIRRDGRCRVAIGKDTRRSSYMLEYALAAGLTSSGADAYLMHVTTTPAVSFAVRTEGFDFGVMISASHNPYYDNGIKLMGADGEKLSQSVIGALEEHLDGKAGTPEAATDDGIGRTVDHIGARNRYAGHIISLSKYSYRGIRVGLDCANGSAWMLGRSIFETLDADVCAIGCSPNGLNINRECGSTHLAALRELVLEHRLNIGFAFDGDADRCLAVCENGEVLTGDHLLYIFALKMKAEGKLADNTVVSTVMSNMGLSRALEREGVKNVVTQVGDRYVCEAMKNGAYSLGGEESGHIIFSKYSTTGDGLVTAVKLMEAYIESGRAASHLSDGFALCPQLTVNVPVSDKDALMEDRELLFAVQRERELLADSGRLLVRKSGTENVIRVMAEAESEPMCRDTVERIACLIRRKNGEV